VLADLSLNIRSGATKASVLLLYLLYLSGMLLDKKVSAASIYSIPDNAWVAGSYK